MPKKKSTTMYGIQPHTSPGHYVVWEAPNKPALYNTSKGKLQRVSGLDPNKYKMPNAIRPKKLTKEKKGGIISRMYESYKGALKANAKRERELRTKRKSRRGF